MHGKGGAWAYSGNELHQAQDDATKLAIGVQESVRLDEITDGEQRRESYLSYVVKRLNGFDYQNFGEKWVRGGRRLAPGRSMHGPRDLARPHASWKMCASPLPILTPRLR